MIQEIEKEAESYRSFLTKVQTQVIHYVEGEKSVYEMAKNVFPEDSEKTEKILIRTFMVMFQEISES